MKPKLRPKGDAPAVRKREAVSRRLTPASSGIHNAKVAQQVEEGDQVWRSTPLQYLESSGLSHLYRRIAVQRMLARNPVGAGLKVAGGRGRGRSAICGGNEERVSAVPADDPRSAGRPTRRVAEKLQISQPDA